MALSTNVTVGGFYSMNPQAIYPDATMAIWFQATSDDGANHDVITTGKSTAASVNDGWGIRAALGAASNPLRGIWLWADNSTTVETTGIVAGTWHHGCVVVQRQNLWIDSGLDSSVGTAYIQSDGSAWTCGAGTNGELGNDTTGIVSSPVSVVGGHRFRQISRGANGAAALKTDGSAWCWGDNTNGELGNNDSGTDQSSPVSVVGAHSFNTASGNPCIVRGASHAVAVKASDGTAWGWGANAAGQLGDGTVTARSSPVSVLGAHSFGMVTCGQVHTAALKTNNGTVWCWGNGGNGRLGDGTATSKSSPVSVLGAHSFGFVTGGTTNTYGLKTNNGTVWSWGANGQGQIGDNSTTARSSPVSVVGAHSFTAIDGGFSHIVALKADGSAWCWGQGTSGQLGDNTINPRSSPVSVVGDHSFVKISAGASYSLGLKANGEIWGWGNNGAGRMGDGTATNRSSPVFLAPMAVNHGVASGITVYLDGANASTARVTGVPNIPDRMYIGSNAWGTAGGTEFVGGVAEAAVWDCALDASEIAALAKGFDPALIRPANLKGYWPMIRETSPMDVTGRTGVLAQSSAPGVVAHPRMFKASNY